MTNHTRGKMTATDTHGVIGDNFWPELQHRIARAARMTPVEASKMMGKFISDNCDRWPYNKAIAASADLRAMYERALEIRNAPRRAAQAAVSVDVACCVWVLCERSRRARMAFPCLHRTKTHYFSTIRAR
jgi:hypothetical protein